MTVSDPVAFVLKGYPRLSETFIAQEILALERRGLDIRIISLRHPTDQAVHPVHREIAAPVLYLPEYLYREPLRVLRAVSAARKRPGWSPAVRLWWRDLKRDPTPNRVRRFGQALVLARELDAEISHIHAHFLHTPASVARYCAILTGRSWSFSAHARDIWTSPDWEKAEKLKDAAWGVTCTAHALNHLASLDLGLGLGEGEAGGLDLVYHGLDLERLGPHGGEESSRDGGSPENPVRLLSVGRAVEKKGYDTLMAALAQLPPTLSWRLVHVGGGPLLKALKRQAKKLGLESRIDWRGPQPQEDVFAAYARADLFVLCCRPARDKDQDGLPNVLLEAQAFGLACVSTRLSGIPELIEEGINGRLVTPGDAAGIAAALKALIADPAARNRMGRAGAARVHRDFQMTRGIDFLSRRFGLENQTPAEI